MHERTGWMMTIVAVMIAGGALPARAVEAADYAKLINDKAPALVTIKFVLKVSMGAMMGPEQESENEITAVMIDPKGVLLCSNTQLSGFTGMMRRLMGSMGSEISARPLDLRVLIGDEAKEHEAELLARDSELDLAWVKIKEPGDRTFEHVDFATGTKLELGQEVVVVRRLDKFFARTPAVSHGRVGGITRKPRDLYIPTGEVVTALGLPVYTTDGRVAGFTVMQAPDEEDTEMNPMAVFSRLSSLQNIMAAVVLPAADVAKATRRAMESAETESAENESTEIE
ncbi:MAG: trypsin-like peptidase domain-containing protein [Phycisphaerae bacterium]